MPCLAAPRALFEEQAGCFVVRDASGRTLGYFYFAEETTENVFRFSGGIFGRLVQAAPVAFSSTLLTKLG